MQSFVDAKGRKWDINITVASLKAIRAETSVDLLRLGEDNGEVLTLLVSDPIKLADVLYAACRPSVSDIDFGEALRGDAIEAATKALLTDLADFCPSPQRRQNLHRALAAMWKAMEDFDQANSKRVDAEILKFQAAVAEHGGGLSGNAPASAA